MTLNQASPSKGKRLSEFYHPTHQVEVRIYEYAELPFIRQCREIKESFKTDEMTEEEATKRVLEIKQWLFTKDKMTQSS